ncbi:hypothetical protein ACQEU6_36480 [Spirillospora sp. CA-108201]
MKIGHLLPTRDRAAGGVPFRTRFSRLEESIEAMRRLWSGKDVSIADRILPLLDV